MRSPTTWWVSSRSEVWYNVVRRCPLLEFLAGLTMIVIILYLLMPVVFFAVCFGLVIWITIYG